MVGPQEWISTILPVELGLQLLSEARGFPAATSVGELALFGGGWHGTAIATVDIFYPYNPLVTPITKDIFYLQQQLSPIQSHSLFGYYFSLFLF